MMSETAQKCENQAIFKQNYTLQLFIALEMVYYCCFSKKKFYNINYWCVISVFSKLVYMKYDSSFICCWDSNKPPLEHL